MQYADYSFYATVYLAGMEPKMSDKEFDFFEKRAEKEINLRTFERIQSNPTLLSKEVKECTCAITEFLCEAENVTKAAAAQGLAGPLVSWSNDGESGSIDINKSDYTESGKKVKIRDIIYLYLGNTGLLYAGV